jgi:hypothetical protein
METIVAIVFIRLFLLLQSQQQQLFADAATVDPCFLLSCSECSVTPSCCKSLHNHVINDEKLYSSIGTVSDGVSSNLFFNHLAWSVGADRCLPPIIMYSTQINAHDACLTPQSENTGPAGTAFYRYGEYNASNCTNGTLIAKPQCVGQPHNCTECEVSVCVCVCLIASKHADFVILFMNCLLVVSHRKSVVVASVPILDCTMDAPQEQASIRAHRSNSVASSVPIGWIALVSVV